MAAAVADTIEVQSDTSSEYEVPERHRPALDTIKQHVFHHPQGRETWQLKPEFPTGSEIMVSQAEAEPLLHNCIDSAWPSKNTYLEVQYRLLRREGTEALRYAVNKYKSNIATSDDQDLYIYTKVRILGYLMTRLGPLCRISFSTEHARTKISWQQSRRLMPGSVLAISTRRDNFKSICLTATVAQRPYRGGLDQTPPQVDIVWGDFNEYVVDPDMELIMVEARSGYFEAVRHTLVGLQIAAKSNSPIFKYVVKGDKSDGLASFIQEKPIIDLTPCLSSPVDRDLEEWLRHYDVRENAPDIRAQTSMDDSQLHALYRMITKELCIVQGPPGTGKTFTSVKALKAILTNQRKTDPPIIVAAQTNHALDQLLTLCLDAGAHIVRVGGRTESDRIAEHTMFNTRQKFGSNTEVIRMLDAKRRQACKALTSLASTIFNDGLLQPEDLLSAGVITQEQYDSLVDDDMEQTATHRPHGPFSLWIAGECVETEVVRNKHCDEKLADDDEWYNGEEYEYEDDFENIADDDEDKDRIHGAFVSFVYKWTGKEPAHLTSWHKRAQRELNKADLYAIPKSMRGAVYQLLYERYIEKLKPQFIKYFIEYNECCKEVKAHKWLHDVHMVRQLQVNIVGCTTTGLTKYRGFLAALGARTMLVEEAAETRESNITSALYPSIQQLILVGDHMQLAPSCNIHWLGQKPYYLDLSMFERMVEYLGIPYIMLDKQRRMAPEIRAVMHHFYDGLLDHPVALTRDPVPGMGRRRTWLFSHNWEDSIDPNRSRFNVEEASMIVNFFAYLVNNGIKQSHITVLTFYKAQRSIILKKMKMHPSLATSIEPYHVHTVDSYQGEENDIVLLSLVRSPAANGEHAVGFLGNKNRVIVAISRARRGFYMFGNIVNAANASNESSAIWTPIWNAFIAQERFDPTRGLPLKCRLHSKTIWIKNTSGWADNAGGCDQRCDFQRDCGHQCAFPCHTKPHDQIRCSHVCGKMLACGHVCQIWCKDPCNCLCASFQSLKTQNEARHMQEEDQMHMNLEDLLHAEAGHSPQPQATISKPEDMQMVLAKHARLPMLPPVITTSSIVRPLTQKIAMPPSQMAGPIVRLPFQGPQRPTKPGIEAYRNFVLNIDAHDKAVATAQLASLAETSGQVPTIHDNYRPVFIIDGRRIESSAKSNPKKEAKRTQQDQTQSPRVNTPKTRLTDSLLPEVLFKESETAGEENKANSHVSDVDALIDAHVALPTDGNALPMSLRAEHPARCCSPGKDDGHSQSTESAVAASADNPGLPVDGIVLDAAAVNPSDDIAGKGKGKASLDLATLADQPTARSLTASRLGVALKQDENTHLQQCSSVDNWTETLSLEALGMEQLMQRQEQTDIMDLHTPATMRPENEGDEKTEEVPINL